MTKKYWHVFLFLLLFIVSFLFSYITNISARNSIDGLGILKSFVILPILFAVGIFLLAQKKQISLYVLLTAFFASAVMQSFIGYAYTLQNYLTYDNRLGIFYESPNQFAMILAPAILIGLYFLQCSARKKLILKNYQKFLLLTGILSLLFSLYLTHSHGAWIALMISFAMLALIPVKRLRIAGILTLLILATGSLIIFNLSSILGLFRYAPSVPATAIDSRITIYTVSQKISLKDWLLGIGPGNFQSKYLSVQPLFSPFPQWAAPHAHNNILHLFIEGGIGAMLSFAFLVFFFCCCKRTKKPCTGFFIVAVYLLLHGIVDTTLWRNDISVLWWLAFMLSGTVPFQIANR
ncbi:MAG: O-antigen ligase family protein [Patescibacteria group bacterium]|nr:O-antigen ligase family protein [Patescibacteria group bacterium]